MSAANLRAADLGSGHFLVTWTDDDHPSGPWDVWVNGALSVRDLRLARFELVVPQDGRELRVDVVDSAGFPGWVPEGDGTLGLRFAAVSWATGYRLDWWSGSAWVEQARIEETGQVGYELRTPGVLADETTHTVRVVAESPGGSEFVLATRVGLMVRVPNRPAVVYSVPSAGTLRVANG